MVLVRMRGCLQGQRCGVHFRGVHSARGLRAIAALPRTCILIAACRGAVSSREGKEPRTTPGGAGDGAGDGGQARISRALPVEAIGDDGASAEGNTNRRTIASAWSARRGRRTWRTIGSKRKFRQMLTSLIKEANKPSQFKQGYQSEVSPSPGFAAGRGSKGLFFGLGQSHVQRRIRYNSWPHHQILSPIPLRRLHRRRKRGLHNRYHECPLSHSRKRARL